MDTHNGACPHGSQRLVFPWEALGGLFKPPPLQAALPRAPHSHFHSLAVDSDSPLDKTQLGQECPVPSAGHLGLQLYLVGREFSSAQRSRSRGRGRLQPEVGKERPPTPGPGSAPTGWGTSAPPALHSAPIGWRRNPAPPLVSS